MRSEIDLNECEHWTLSQSEAGSIYLNDGVNYSFSARGPFTLASCGSINRGRDLRNEIDLSQKSSECERSNANWDSSKRDTEIDLNESEIDLTSF